MCVWSFVCGAHNYFYEVVALGVGCLSPTTCLPGIMDLGALIVEVEAARAETHDAHNNVSRDSRACPSL